MVNLFGVLAKSNRVRHLYSVIVETTTPKLL